MVILVRYVFNTLLGNMVMMPTKNEKDELRFIGSSKISSNNRVTLPPDVLKKLEDPKTGDNVLFFVDDGDHVIIEASAKVT